MGVRGYICIATIAFVAGSQAAHAAALRGPCDDSLTQSIPARAADAPGGQAFAQAIRGLSDDERESRIQHELLAGNIPKFLRALVPIRLRSTAENGAPVDIVICAALDYLAIGSDDDFLLMPMRLGTALSTAGEFGFTLPTPRMVDAIYAQAAVHFVPQPLPAGSEMRSTEYSLRHNEMVGAQRAALDVSLGSLVAGDKKDLVLTNRLRSHLNVVRDGTHAANALGDIVCCPSIGVIGNVTGEGHHAIADSHSNAGVVNTGIPSQFAFHVVANFCIGLHKHLLKLFRKCKVVLACGSIAGRYADHILSTQG